MKMPTSFNAPKDCPHDWQPVSFAFEKQLLDEHGRVSVRQPDINEGKVYFLCAACASHTYMTTQFVGYRMYGSEDVLSDADKSTPSYPQAREAWSVEEEADGLAIHNRLDDLLYEADMDLLYSTSYETDRIVVERLHAVVDAIKTEKIDISDGVLRFNVLWYAIYKKEAIND